MSEKITFAQAIKSVAHFLVGSNPTNQDIHPSLPPADEESASEHHDDIIEDDCVYTEDGIRISRLCPKCGKHMELYKDMSTDLINMVVYYCDDCKIYHEFDYELPSERLIKDSTIYDGYARTNTSYIEATIRQSNPAVFSLNHLWEICGIVCYPAIIKTNPNVDACDLVFIKATDDIFHDKIEGFLLTQSNMIANVSLSRNSSISFITNPYLARAPHIDFTYMATPTQENSSIACISSVRFRYKKSALGDGNSNTTVNELTFIEDFAFHDYGLEVYVKFISSSDNSDRALLDVIHSIDLRHIIINSNEIHLEDGYSIQVSHVSKINLYSMNSNVIDEDIRRRFYKDICEFVEYI